MKIKGNNKPNELIGTDEDDKIFGMDGNDTIIAQGGHDDVDGGDGDDKITISANTSATVDAGKGDDKVKLSAAALASEIDLGKGNDTVEVKDSNQSNQAFVIAGGKGDDAVNFVLDQDQYADVTENGDGAFTITDVNGNTYTITSIETLTFNGALYQEPGNPINEAPVVSNPSADQTSIEDAAFSFQVAAFTDPDGDALTYSATLSNGNTLPTWLSFDAASRTFSGTPGDSDVGAISVRVTASDGSLSSFDDFTITVNSAPIVVPPGPTIVDPVVVGGVLYLDRFYDYDVSEGAGMIAVSYAGKNILFDAATINSIVTIGSSSVDIDTNGWTVPRGIDGNVNFVSVTFDQANVGPGYKFDASFDLSNLSSISGTVTVNGTTADYFRTAWDYFDEQYGLNPNNETNNLFGIELGIQYAQWIEAGNSPLDDIVKFSADTNSDGIPQRQQTLHDNLLGNFYEPAIDGRFGSNATTVKQMIENATQGDYLGILGINSDGRGYYDGNQSSIGTPAHIQVLTFDYAHGFERDDYNSFVGSGTVDAAATNGAGAMRMGTGNSPSGFAISQHEGAGIETALKVHLRQGADIVGTVGSNGVVTYDVPTGAQPAPNGNPAWGPPAAWNFDYSIVTGLNGTTTDVDDFDFVLRIDTDSTGAVNYVDFNLVATGAGGHAFVGPAPTDVSGGTNYGNTHIAQDSINFGFNFIESKIDGGNYAFGAGTFDVELIAYEKGSLHTSSDILSNVHIQLLV